MNASINQERLMKVLLSPHISEKGSLATQNNRQYVFKVIRDANKHEISRAVELLFNVKVDAVQILNVKCKTKRFGQMQGQRKAWKKAYVKLAEGQQIEITGAQA